MDAPSPPKRMTRARAAAKASEPAAKVTRVATAAARAKTARSTTTTTTTTTTSRTAVKRKSPSDDEGEDHEMQPAKKMTAVEAKPTRGRGRPRKVAAEAPAPEPAPAPAARPRGRPRKNADPVPAEPPKPARTTRAVRKAATEETQHVEAAPEPAKRTTRGRSALTSATAASTARSLAKPAVKKTVKFEEPEKENVAPATATTKKASAKASTAAPTAGLRGKPVRRGASTAAARPARTTRAAAGAAKAGDKAEKPMPLSPKKVNQMTMNRVESDDELGMDENIPVRRLRKLPIKPAMSGAKAAVAKVSVPVGENDENAVVASLAEIEVKHMLATPAKRLPPSPWKGSIKSPAKRVEGLVVATVSHAEGETVQAPPKMGLLQSPAKRQPRGLTPLAHDSINVTASSPVKLSFLSSPAKRPPVSPIKPLPRTIEEEQEPFVIESPALKPALFASPLPRGQPLDVEKEHSPTEDVFANAVMPESPTRLNFPGRLSAVLPRHANPALTPPAQAATEDAIASEPQEEPIEDTTGSDNEAGGSAEPMALDNPPEEPAAVGSVAVAQPTTPPKTSNPMFGLREKDLSPYNQSDSESDDDSPVRHNKFTSAFSTLPATPKPAAGRASNVTPSAGRSTTRKLRSDNKLGFTPLAEKLGVWTAGATPLKTATPSRTPATGSTSPDNHEKPATPANKTAFTPPEPAQNTFFDDEMHVRPEAMEAEEDAATEVEDNDETVLEDQSCTEEDMELAAEANGMSLVEKEPADHSSQDDDDSASEASQEYGDENMIPVDPALTAGNGLSAAAAAPVTPQRTVHREFHTVAKVPLKPADDATPRPKLESRSYSASRLSATRPTERLTRNATVISYSPTKGGDALLEDVSEDLAEDIPPVTPQKADIWSTIGTPARTPRRDLNPALLRGAVVFVDVHTSEGADASGIFVELLTQMGARCVKTWAWNPNGSESGADSRVGITHVVYKDGGKRTLEKVRESGGVVQCVGVSWVLDCERENEWLDEAPYQIDTSIVPRGGARRRKSMEPRAVANLNGMLVPADSNPRGTQTAPSTPANNRRASSLWVWSPGKPLDEDDDADADGAGHDDDDDDTEWGTLTPVPKTPAPEAVARFIANITPGPMTPSSAGSAADDDDDDDDDEDEDHGHYNGGRGQEDLLRTCPPPKRTAFVELGDSILSREKDERVLMRLMAARRKSLQFAPKVGSPLAKAWKAWN